MKKTCQTSQELLTDKMPMNGIHNFHYFINEKQKPKSEWQLFGRLEIILMTKFLWILISCPILQKLVLKTQLTMWCRDFLVTNQIPFDFEFSVHGDIDSEVSIKTVAVVCALQKYKIFHLEIGSLNINRIKNSATEKENFVAKYLCWRAAKLSDLKESNNYVDYYKYVHSDPYQEELAKCHAASETVNLWKCN